MRKGEVFLHFHIYVYDPARIWPQCQDKILKLTTPLHPALHDCSLVWVVLFLYPFWDCNGFCSHQLLQETELNVEVTQGFTKISWSKTTYRINWKAYDESQKSGRAKRWGCGRKGSISNSSPEKLGENKYSKSYRKENLEWLERNHSRESSQSMDRLGNHAGKSRRVQECICAERNPACSGAIKHLILSIYRQAPKFDWENTVA